MKVLILALGLAFSGPAIAKQVILSGCKTKAYSCQNAPGGPYCQWQYSGPRADLIVDLVAQEPTPPPREPALLNEAPPPAPTPNPGPTPVPPPVTYQARYRAMYDSHLIDLDFVVTNGQLKTGATISYGNSFAETSGQTGFDIGIRNQNYGRGFTCPTITVTQ